MKAIVDTQLLLWTALQPDRLSSRARAILEDPASQLWFSAASLWEIAIKRSRRRDDFQVDPKRLRTQLLSHGYEELVVTGDHAIHVEAIPPIHGDPFDRLLLAQAHIEGMTLITADGLLARYGSPAQQV